MFRRAICLFFILGLFSSSEAQSRRYFAGHVPDAVNRLRPLEEVPATKQLRLAVGLPLRNRAALTRLLQDLYDPASPGYHQYLTPAQFADQFGATREDYQKVIDYFTARGLKVTATHANRVVISFAGAAGDVARAFHVHLRSYQHPTENRRFFAPDTAPWVDSNVPMLDVMGLDNFVLPHSMSLRRAQDQAGVTNYLEQGSGPNNTYIGRDFRAAYLPGVTNTGSGQYIGLMEFGPYWPNDVPTYESIAGISNVVISNIFLDGVTEPPATNTDAGEQALDIEMSISMAPGATVLYYGGEVVDDILSRMASDNLAKQLSCSFGFGIDATTEQLYQEFVAQGQNYFVASGDAGAYVGTINPPAAEPYCTYCGGTALFTASHGGPWTNETAWVGSGGGVSTFYAIPNYQQGINMTPLFGSSTMRNFPDVSMLADTVIFIAANNGTGTVGGTSCSTPLWAGFYALANQQAAALGHPPIGFFNPILYAIGQSTNYTNCFHDVTNGNTTNFSSGPNRFFAARGYDLATGWGSPTGSNLINALTGVGTNNFMLYASPATQNVTAGGSAAFLVTVQPMNQFSGAVALSCAGLPAGVTASFSPASTAGTSLLTLSASSTTVAGTSTVTVTGISGAITQTTALTLTVLNATSSPSPAGLSSFFNSAAIYTDGTTFSGGADGGGRAYSARLLGSTLSWNGCVFTLGPANANDVIRCANQTITLPSGNFSSLQLLATAVDGAQSGRQFTVTYTDGSTSVFTQSLSDWTSPQNFPGETVVAATAYRNTGSGTADTVTRAFIYGYSFSLNNNKTVRSINVPNDSDVLVFAMTLDNDFTLFANPTSLILTAGGKSTCLLTSAPLNGLSGSVSLALSNLPPGVTASFSAGVSPNTLLTLTASATAPPSNAAPYITATLAGLTHTVILPLSVITPIPGPAPVNLASAYNLSAIVTDGASFGSSGGMDGAGDAYSSNLLTAAPGWNGSLFTLGGANQPDAVAATGQTIVLPAGQYTGLLMLAAAVNGSQPNQIFQVNYTDGTTALVSQSISVWTASQKYTGESVAAAMAYTDSSGGTENTAAPVNVYGYTLALNDSKTVQSVTLPSNANVVVLAMTLANAPRPVSLAFNRTGIYTDGSTYSGGADSDGNAYSSNQLGSTVIWDNVAFQLGPANAADMVACAGQTVSLPADRYTTLLLLAAGVNGSQLSQTFTVNYTDGTSASLVQSISDWAGFNGYSNQFVAASMPYRNNGSGGLDQSTTYLLGCILPLNNTKTVQSLRLPNNNNVDILAVTLANTPLPASLQSNDNIAGLYTDGTQFTGGGLDQSGNAYSATLLGPYQTWNNMRFNFGLANLTNAVTATGQSIPLPPGQYSALSMLATAVNGSQTAQLFTVHYTNGTTTSFSQSLSDWAAPQHYSGETVVAAMGYRDSSGGSLVGPAVDLYGYSVALNSNNVVQSITLPNNANVKVLAITLSNFTAALPGIVAQPQSLTVTNGNPASFSVTAVGTPTLHYQWESNGVALANGAGFSGVNNNVLTINPTTTNDDASYTVVVNNSLGAVTSSVATLFVGVPPGITNQPLPLNVTNGSPAVFTVGATGTPPLAYQWQDNQTNLADGGEISGSTNSALSLAPAGANDTGNYDVVVSNAFGSVTSSIVTLDVVFVFNSATLNGNAITFSWTTTPGVNYQVQYTTDLSSSNWINLGGPITATNAVTTNFDVLGTDPQRFYRILQQ